jgi:hypothetical protein
VMTLAPLWLGWSLQIRPRSHSCKEANHAEL